MCSSVLTNNYTVIHPDLLPNAALNVGSPSRYSSIFLTLGKIYTEETTVPIALIIHTNVTNSPLSAEAIRPICFFPFRATTFQV